MGTKTVGNFEMHSKPDNTCRVCGFLPDEPPWGEDAKTPTFDICPCCGVEYGYEDSTLVGVKKFREEWIKNGCRWFDKDAIPINWKLSEQLKNIPFKWK